MSIGKRLKALRELRGMSQDDVVAKVGITQGSMHRIEMLGAETKYTVAFAIALNCDPIWLETGNGVSPFAKGAQHLKATLQVPIFKPEEVFTYIKLKGKKIMETENRSYVGAPARCSDKAFAVKVLGDSMTADHGAKFSMLEGTVLVADPEMTAKNEDYVVANVKDNPDGTLIRQYISDGQNTYLRALNPAYESIKVNSDVEIYAVVVSQIIELKR